MKTYKVWLTNKKCRRSEAVTLHAKTPEDAALAFHASRCLDKGSVYEDNEVYVQDEDEQTLSFMCSFGHIVYKVQSRKVDSHSLQWQLDRDEEELKGTK